MPVRQTPLVNDHYYHIYNRGVARAPVFQSKFDYEYMLKALSFYRFYNVPVKLSTYTHLPEVDKDRMVQTLERDAEHLVEVVAFVLMPNHFHLLLKQKGERGIITYMARVGNSYVRYFNTKRQRVGPLFQGVYKAVRVESNEQLLHLSRYIHLNPFVSGLTTIRDLLAYPWSSFSSYIENRPAFIKPDAVLSQFPSPGKYKEFVFDQADYSKTLEDIKHEALDFEAFPDV